MAKLTACCHQGTTSGLYPPHIDMGLAMSVSAARRHPLGPSGLGPTAILLLPQERDPHLGKYLRNTFLPCRKISHSLGFAIFLMLVSFRFPLLTSLTFYLQRESVSSHSLLWSRRLWPLHAPMLSDK